MNGTDGLNILQLHFAALKNMEHRKPCTCFWVGEG